MDFRTFSKLVMLEQTLFALPFAFIGILFAGGGTWTTWLWVIVALISARTAGMSFNRIIDAEIDAKNPRTRERLLPSGQVGASQVWSIAALSCVILIGSAYMLNKLCFILSFPAIGLLFTYSYFKRFTASSHFYLGLVEAAAPIGGYFAVTGRVSLFPFLLGFVIMTWIAGLDIVYAIQDMEFDSREGLHSIPAAVGRERALFLSALCYLLSVGGMVWAGILSHMGFPYWLALICTALIFIYQQTAARSKNIPLGIRRFFRSNMFIAPTLFLGTFIDVYLI